MGNDEESQRMRASPDRDICCSWFLPIAVDILHCRWQNFVCFVDGVLDDHLQTCARRTGIAPARRRPERGEPLGT